MGKTPRPRSHDPRQAGAVSSVSMVALIVEYLGGSPYAKNGMRVQRIMRPSRASTPNQQFYFTRTRTGTVGTAQIGLPRNLFPLSECGLLPRRREVRMVIGFRICQAERGYSTGPAWRIQKARRTRTCYRRVPRSLARGVPGVGCARGPHTHPA